MILALGGPIEARTHARAPARAQDGGAGPEKAPARDVMAARDVTPAQDGAPVQDGAPALVDSTIVLRSGEVLRGVVVEVNQDAVIVSHAVLGRLSLPRAAIYSIAIGEVPPPPDGAQVPAASKETDANVPAPEGTASSAPIAPSGPSAAPASPKIAQDPPRPAWAPRIDLLEVDGSLPAPGEVRWIGSVQAAASGVESDNDEFDLRAAAAFARLTENDKLSASAEYFLSLLNGQSTDNNLLATGVYDRYLLPSDWLAFGKLQYQYDEFQAWENRLSAYAGLGYRIFHERPFALTIKGGAGATHEFGDVDETTPEAYGEAALAWWIDERQVVEASINVAPDITDWSQYRVIARLDYSFRLDTRGLALVLGLREEYQARVTAGSTRNDFRYYAGIRMDF